jgi:hypothetical protein
VNDERRFFVSREAIERVMAKAPSAEWKLLIALGRYGGLRVPSEVVGLKIGDVDVKRGRITITSPKTEKQGKAKRVIPLWPELHPLIEKVIQSAAPDQVRLLPSILPGYNPHTQFVRLIDKAWPKVWQNLRSTRETELLKDFPIHVVCGWIGNTERIARRHYLQITDADFDQATGVQRAAKSAAIRSSEHAQLAQVEATEPRVPAENADNAVLVGSSSAQDRGRTTRDSTRDSGNSANGAARGAANDPELAGHSRRSSGWWNGIQKSSGSRDTAFAFP